MGGGRTLRPGAGTGPRLRFTFTLVSLWVLFLQTIYMLFMRFNDDVVTFVVLSLRCHFLSETRRTS